MKQIVIDKEKLEAFIAKRCFYYRETSDTKEPMCNKPRANECNMDYIEKIELECPYDCPHRNEYKWKQCTFGKCPTVAKTIKSLRQS